MLEKNEKDLEVVEVSEPVEETKVETPVEVVEEPLPEEVEVIEYELGVTVEEETYVVLARFGNIKYDEPIEIITNTAPQIKPVNNA